jgi:hypothetical protein
MARLGVPPHVADKILNHQAGTISGVAAVYQRHDFLAERLEALDRWGVHVDQIVQTFDQSNDAQLLIAPTEKNDSASEKTRSKVICTLNLELLRPLFEANFAFRDVGFSASSGLSSDITPLPKSATMRPTALQQRLV